MPIAFDNRYLETIGKCTCTIKYKITTRENPKKEKNYEIRTGVSGAWAGSPCSRPAFLQLA
jgi:hypothetical protein